MLTTLIVLVLAVIALVLLLLVIVAAGIRHEPPASELGSRAPSLIAALTRRLLGVYVRKSSPAAELDRQPCLNGHAVAGPAAPIDDKGR